MTAPRFNAFRDGEIHVIEEKCTTCIFRPGNLMRLTPGRVRSMKDDADEESSAIICHQTLPVTGAEDQAICRGYYDTAKDKNITLKLAQALNVLVYDKRPKD